MVPAMSDTMVRSSLRMALTSEDLPALGLPTIAILRPSRFTSCSAASMTSLSGLTTASMASAMLPMLRPNSAETVRPAPYPSEAKSPDSCS